MITNYWRRQPCPAGLLKTLDLSVDAVDGTAAPTQRLIETEKTAFQLSIEEGLVPVELANLLMSDKVSSFRNGQNGWLSPQPSMKMAASRGTANGLRGEWLICISFVHRVLILLQIDEGKKKMSSILTIHWMEKGENYRFQIRAGVGMGV